MKSFDEFVKHVNENMVEELLNVPIPDNVCDKIDITTADGIGKIISSTNIRTIQQFMLILRAYHEWANKKDD